MKISETIKVLKEIYKKHGDLEVTTKYEPENSLEPIGIAVEKVARHNLDTNKVTKRKYNMVVVAADSEMI